jgi:hypothetical protein
MKKDIPILKVEDLIVAIAPRDPSEENRTIFWDGYLINLKEEPIYNVVVNTRGYGQIDGEPRKTTTMRYFWEVIGPLNVVKVEPLPVDLMDLTNEYWVSFSFEDYLYDKKYVFVPGSLDPRHFAEVPFLGKRGVMIR